LELVRNLLTINGARIDAWMDESGKPHGRVTPDTRYLVMGMEPDESAELAEIRKGVTAMITDAERLGIETISLADLLASMGWKHQTPVIVYGPGQRAEDFEPSPPEVTPRTSGGSVSPLFMPRQPPSGTVRRSAY
jgi:hypothetical protein